MARRKNAKMTKRQRSEAARKAVNARWAKMRAEKAKGETDGKE